MRRKAFLTMLASSLLASGATGAWAAAAPFGSFDGFARGGNAANGVVAVQGWALAETGVFAVDIVVDGAIVGRANYGRSRPRVTKLHPGLPDSAAPGFGYELDTTHFLNGMHTVTARVESRTSQVVYLNSRQFQFANTNADLLPFGKIEFPNQQAELSGNGDGQPDLFGNCDVDHPDRQPIWSIVSGYALDVNAARNNPGVAYVELLIDGALTFSSQLDCHFDSTAGGLTDCYGIRRIDLEQVFPGLKDAPHAGFRFALDVGALIGTTDSDGFPLYTPGSHQLGIRVGDQFENVTDIASIVVTFTCRDFTQDDLSIGQIDYPVVGLVYGNVIRVSGWALDFQGVRAVQVFVDGNFITQTSPFFPRPDIASLYPSYPNALNSGWLTFIDTTQFSNGTHQLSVQVVDNLGNNTFIGKFPFTVENPIP
jgi:Bacterial Ig domain